MKTFWWVRKGTYFLFVMRELSSIFVAWWVVFLLILVAAVGKGEGAYDDFLDFAANPAVITLNVIAFAFLVLHTVTWFALTPKAMDVRLRGRPVPALVVTVSQYVGLLVVSGFIYWLVTG
jgi:fumarate reductase subunit C